ncbi:MAG: hypothetical protein II883_05875 [Spirochaetales bacterium]|nr:hypothetical protein [Spirochaetales bacterium]
MSGFFKKIGRFISDKDFRSLYLAYLGLYDREDDESFLRRKFKALLHYEPDFSSPKTFNEKMNWLKLHDRNPSYVSLVDKYEVKQIVSEIIGPEYVIPNLGIWDNPEAIDFDALPDQFVLKCSHDSGSRVICPDKSKLDFGKARRIMAKSLDNDYYLLNREWPYKDVRRRILAEKYIESKTGELNDYRFYCFNGEPGFFSIDLNVRSDIRVNFYDPDLSILPFGSAEEPPDFNAEVTIPDNIGEMFDIARTLSKGHPFIRVDLYNVEGKIYFSELTFFSYGGFLEFYPDRSWDEKIGACLDLPGL